MEALAQEVGYSEEAQLASDISTGSSISEERLIEKYRSGLVLMLTRLTQDPYRAEDLAHDALILVINKLREDQINQPHKLTLYVYSTARYMYFGWLRKMDNQVELREALDDIASATPSVDHELLSDEQHDHLSGSINKLTVERDRQILSRFYLYEQTKPEICDALRLSVDHYDRVISRARNRLRAQVTQDESQVLQPIG